MATNRDFENALKQGDTLAAQGRQDEAIAAYRQAAQFDPTNAQARRQIINMCNKKEEYQESFQEYLEWADALVEKGKTDDAIKALQEGIALGSSSESKGSILQRRASPSPRLKEAFSKFSPHLYARLGDLLYQKKSLSECIDALNKSLEISPTARAHCTLGFAYLEKGLDDKAKGEFQEVVKLAPDDAATAYEKLADIHAKQGKAVQSIVIFLKNAADTYLRKGQDDEAVRVYQKILSMERENKEVLTRLGEVYASRGLTQEAVKIYVHLAEIYSQEGLYDRVIFLYEKLLDWDPGNIEVRSKVIEIYRTYLNIDPGNINARHKLIENLIGKGASEEAIPEFLALARTYLQMGMREEAVTYFKKILEMDPGNPPARRELATLLGKEFEEPSAQAAGQEQAEGPVRAEAIEAGVTAEEAPPPAAPPVRPEEAPVTQAAPEEEKPPLQPVALEQLIEAGLSCLEEGEMDRATEIFLQVIERDSQNVAAIYSLGEVALRQGAQDKAMALFEKAVSLDSSHLEARKKLLELSEGAVESERWQSSAIELAGLLQEKGRGEEAGSVFKRVLVYNPENLEVRSRLCSIYLQTERIREAKDEALFLLFMYVKKGILTRAIEVASLALQADPGDLNVRYKIARISSKMGLVQEASRELIGLAQTYAERKLPFKAVEVFHNLMELEPENFQHHNSLGELLVAQDLIEEAVRHYLNLVSLYEEKGLLGEGIQALKRVLQIKPAHLEAALKLGDLVIKERKGEEIIGLLSELAAAAVSRKETEEGIMRYLKIAEIHRSLEHPAPACQILETIARIRFDEGKEQDGVQVLREAAGGYLETKNVSKFLEVSQFLVDRAVERNLLSDILRAYKDAIRGTLTFDERRASLLEDDCMKFLLTKERVKELDRTFRELARDCAETGHPRHAGDLLNKLGEMYARIYKLDEAVTLYSQALQLSPERVDLRLRLADLYLHRENLPAALDQYLQSIHQLTLQGEHEKVEEVLRIAESKSPNDPTFISSIAQTYYEKGDWDGAELHFKRALEYDPGHSRSLVGLAMTYARKGERSAVVDLAKKVATRGLIAEIIEEYRTVLALEDPSEASLSLGALYRDLGFMEEAIIEFQNASRDPGKLVEAYKMLGFCFKEQGFADLAMRQFRKGIDHPKFSEEETIELRYHLAKTYEEVGMRKEALDVYTEIYATDIRYKDVEEKIRALSRGK